MNESLRSGTARMGTLAEVERWLKESPQSRTGNFHTWFDAVNEVSALTEQDRLKVDAWMESLADTPFPILSTAVTDYHRVHSWPHIKTVERECNHIWSHFRQAYPVLYKSALAYESDCRTRYVPAMWRLTDLNLNYSRHPGPDTERAVVDQANLTAAFSDAFYARAEEAIGTICDLLQSEIADELKLDETQRLILKRNMIG